MKSHTDKMDILRKLASLSSKENIRIRGPVNSSNSLEAVVEGILKESAELLSPDQGLKNVIKSMNDTMPMGETSDKSYYIPQPLGSQSFPDFVLLIPTYDNAYLILYIECKSSSNGTPVWNCTYPKRMPNVIYVINRTADGSIIVMNGNDAISEKDYLLLKQFDSKIEEWKKVVEEYNKNIGAFYYYPRNMYTQRSKYDFTKSYDVTSYSSISALILLTSWQQLSNS